MSIPVFAPTLDFLTRLHLQSKFVLYKKVYKGEQRKSELPMHPNYTGNARVPLCANRTTSTPPEIKDRYIALDPNNDFDERSVRYWLSLADSVALPHVVHFDSYEQVADILHSMWTDRSRLQAVHEAMRTSNRERLKFLLKYWRRRLGDIAQHSPFKPE